VNRHPRGGPGTSGICPKKRVEYCKLVPVLTTETTCSPPPETRSSFLNPKLSDPNLETRFPPSRTESKQRVGYAKFELHVLQIRVAVDDGNHLTQT